jgi:hypothetical protein
MIKKISIVGGGWRLSFSFDPGAGTEGIHNFKFK